MSIHETIKAGIAEAMKAHDEVRLRTLRSLSAAMTNEVVAKKRRPNEFLTDEEALAVLKRAASQRKDSIAQFDAAGRTDLSTPEKEELTLIEAFLPVQMSREEIEKIVQGKIASMGDALKAGMVVGAVMKEIQGKADGSMVKEVVDALLS
ncbi:MAG: GatB/YqeY domain-containing protein [Minisyncoccia bacterium]